MCGDHRRPILKQSESGHAEQVPVLVQSSKQNIFFQRQTGDVPMVITHNWSRLDWCPIIQIRHALYASAALQCWGTKKCFGWTFKSDIVGYFFYQNQNGLEKIIMIWVFRSITARDWACASFPPTIDRFPSYISSSLYIHESYNFISNAVKCLHCVLHRSCQFPQNLFSRWVRSGSNIWDCASSTPT